MCPHGIVVRDCALVSQNAWRWVTYKTCVARIPCASLASTIRIEDPESRAIPIDRFQPPKGDLSITFMGRLRHALFLMTDPQRTTHSHNVLDGFPLMEKKGIRSMSVLSPVSKRWSAQSARIWRCNH